MTRVPRSILTIFVCLSTTTAAAPTALDAESLYQRGRELVKRGDIAGACETFEGSLRLEPAIGTMLNLADCRERQGKLASAWELFLRAASLATRSGARPQVTEARARADALASRLSRITIVVASRPAGFAITRNDQPVDDSMWNQEFAVDGGRYTVAATAPGCVPFTVAIEVAGEGDRVRVEVPALQQIRIDKKIRVEPAPEAAPEPEQPPRRRMSPLRWTAIGVAGVGAVAVTAGVVFGRRATSGESLAHQLCPDPACSDPRAVELGDRAHRDANLSTASFIAAGALIGGGVALWLFGAPDGRAPSLAVAPSAGGATAFVRGSF